MSYEIRNYEESFLEKQVEIGSKMINHWPGTAQTQVEGLKNRYAMADFDPELKLYAFKDEQMVGFQTSTIKAKKEDEEVLRANSEFPIVLEGHEEVVELLLQETNKILKAKGVSRVQARGSELWGNTMDFVKKYNYEEKRVLSHTGEFEIKDFKSVELSGKVRPYNKETDYDSVLKMYTLDMGVPEAQILNQFEYIEKNPDQIVCWNVWIEDGEVLGNSVVTSQPESKEAAFANIFARGENEVEVRKAIFEHNLKKLAEKGIEKINLYLTTRYLDKKEQYENLGFSFFPPLKLYHKAI